MTAPRVLWFLLPPLCACAGYGLRVVKGGGGLPVSRPVAVEAGPVLAPAEVALERLPLPGLPPVDESLSADLAPAEVAALLGEVSAGKVRLRLVRLPARVLQAMLVLLKKEPCSARETRLRGLVLEAALARDARSTLEWVSAGEDVDLINGAQEAFSMEAAADPEWAVRLKGWDEEAVFWEVKDLDPAAAMRYLKALSPNNQASVLNSEVMAEFAVSQDFEWVKGLLDEKIVDRERAFKAVGNALFARDAAGFARWLDGVGDDARVSFLGSNLAGEGGFPGADPAQALKMLEQHAGWMKAMGDSGRVNLLSTLAARLWQQDPEAAQRCLAMASPGRQSEIWETFASQLASRTGVEAGLAAAEAAPAALRDAARDAVLPVLAETDPARAAGLISKDAGYAAAVAETYFEKVPAAAAAWWRGLDEERRKFFSEKLETVLGGMQPGKTPVAEVTGFLDSLGDPELARRQAALMVAKLSSEGSEAAALEWVQTWPDPALRTMALAGFIGQRAQTDPEGAARLWAGLPDQGAHEGAARSIAAAWAGVDPAAAMEWASRQTGKVRAEAMEAAMKAAAETYPEEVAAALPNWVEAGVEPGPVMQTIASKWARSAPEAAYAWAAAQPDEDLRGVALTAIVQTVKGFDRERALEMAGALPPGPARDGVLRSVADAGTHALQMAAVVQIQDGALRLRELQKTLRGGLSDDPSAVYRALEPGAASPISPEDRAVLRNLLPSP